MKRLVFCFDGTWNKVDAEWPTNVVVTAESVLPLARGNVAQLIYYDEGVGTSRFDRIRGGVLGNGLVQNLAEAYRFLIFNYTSGDEIYIFGFSRGAYTARSFAGLLSTCAIPLRKHAGRVEEAIEEYKRRNDSEDYRNKMLGFRSELSPNVCVSDAEFSWRKSNLPDFESEGTSVLNVKYLGVWDTVGALGIPTSFEFLSWANKKHRFHDTNLSAFVKSARHAVAIDERRKDFAPTLWTNLDSLNNASGFSGELGEAPYQQVWFPGTHSSVGGGGERRGLSDQALDWVLDGARVAGLELDHSGHSRIFELKPDYSEHLENSLSNGTLYKIMNAISAADRLPGPARVEEVSLSAKRRWKLAASFLKDNKEYRPPTLNQIARELDSLVLEGFDGGKPLEFKSSFNLYEVKKGDSLTKIAKEQLGSAKRADDIFKANLDKLENKHRIYTGSLLRIPK
jgi:uncharacterized protein (DUF2235 family)